MSEINIDAIMEIKDDKERSCLYYQDCSICPYGEAYQIVDTWRYRCKPNEA